MCSRIDIDRDRARFRGSPEPVGRTRLLPKDKAVDILAGVYDRVCNETPGMFERNRDWWEAHRLADPEGERYGGGPLLPGGGGVRRAGRAPPPSSRQTKG